MTAGEEKERADGWRALAGEKIIELGFLKEELKERRDADAELGGTNSCVDDGRLAKLFLKHRKIAQDLQRKWVAEKAGDKRDAEHPTNERGSEMKRRNKIPTTIEVLGEMERANSEISHAFGASVGKAIDRTMMKKPKKQTDK